MRTLVVFVFICVITLVQCGTERTGYPKEIPVIEDIDPVCIFIETVVEDEETILEMVMRVSLEVGLEPNIALALLKEENSRYDPFADHYNETSDSHDLGLFQINDRFIETDFIPRYWKSDEPFDVFDAESNAFVALSHLKYLLHRFDHDVLDAVRAYNGGESAVASNSLKPRTVSYSYRIMETLGYDYEIE